MTQLPPVFPTRRFARIAATLALAAVAPAAAAACGPPGVPAASAAAVANAPPYVGSVFTQCTVVAANVGDPGRAMTQTEFEIGRATIDGCPQHLVLTNPGTDPTWGLSWRYVFALATLTPPTASEPARCGYAAVFAPSSTVACKLAASPTPASPAAPAGT
jgi:hypothetical protein